MIADDSIAVREGLISLLGAHPEFKIVGGAGDGLEAIHMTHQLLEAVAESVVSARDETEAIRIWRSNAKEASR